MVSVLCNQAKENKFSFWFRCGQDGISNDMGGALTVAINMSLPYPHATVKEEPVFGANLRLTYFTYSQVS